jgi:hypothetical protein
MGITMCRMLLTMNTKTAESRIGNHNSVIEIIAFLQIDKYPEHDVSLAFPAIQTSGVGEVGVLSKAALGR